MPKQSLTQKPVFAGPVPLKAWPQIIVGGTIFLLGLIGVVFFFSIPSPGSPALLFLPMIVAAIGAPGLIIGLVTLLGNKQD